MCNPNTQLEEERRRQTVLTATETLNEQRQAREYTLQTPEQVQQAHVGQREQILRRRAELYELGVVPDMNIEQRRAPAPPEPPVSQLSRRQRRKMESKRAGNLKKAQRKHIPGASAETMPMMDAVRDYYKETEKHPVELGGSYNFDARLFSPDLPEEKPCAVDIKKGMTTLAKLKLARRDAEENGAPANDFLYIASHANFTLIEPLETALRTVLAANGVDMDTGRPLMDAQRVAEAAAMRTQAVEAYEKAMAGIGDVLGDMLEERLADQLAEQRAQREQASRESRDERTADLDFVFHYAPEEEEFIKVREAIDAHPEAYTRHRAAIDQRYQQYLDVQRSMAEYGRRIYALEALSMQTEDANLRAQLKKRSNALANSDVLDHLQSLATQHSEAIRFLAAGRPFSDSMQYMYRVMEEEYGIQTETRDAQKQELAFYRTLDEEQQAAMRQLPLDRRATATRMVIALRDRRAAHNNSVGDNGARITAAQKDGRALRGLLQGTHLNENGEPLTEADAQALRHDRALIEAYISGDVARVTPFLDPIIEHVLNFPYETIDLERETLQNPAYMMQIMNQNVYMQNVRRDNPAYFERMPQAKQDYLEACMRVGCTVSCLMVAYMGRYGVEGNSSSFTRELPEAETSAMQIEIATAHFNMHVEALRRARAVYQGGNDA